MINFLFRKKLTSFHKKIIFLNYYSIKNTKKLNLMLNATFYLPIKYFNRKPNNIPLYPPLPKHI